MKTNRFFTIIELLIVITIVALLTVIAITKYQNIEDKASDTIGDYNARAVGHFIETFRAANGAYPSNFHLGTTDVYTDNNTYTGTTPALSNIPPVINKLVDNGLASWTSVRHSCLSQVGIATLSAGADGTKQISTLDPALKMTTPKTAGNQIVALRVDSDWTVDGSLNGTIIRFNGEGMGQMLAEAPWVRADAAQSVAHSEQRVIYAFFFGPTTNTQSVYKTDGSFWKNTKAGMEIKLSERAQYFNYPIILFRLNKTEATFLGALGVSDDGLTLIQ